jgi:hypothetical protein
VAAFSFCRHLNDLKLAPPPEHSSRSAITNFQRVPEQLAPDGPS